MDVNQGSNAGTTNGFRRCEGFFTVWVFGVVTASLADCANEGRHVLEATAAM